MCTANFIVEKLAPCVVCSSCAPVCLRYYEDHIPTSPNFNCVTSHLFRAVIRLMKYELAVIVRFCLCVCFHLAAQFSMYKSVIVAWLSDWFPELIQLLKRSCDVYWIRCMHNHVDAVRVFVQARNHCRLLLALIFMLWEFTHTTGRCSQSSFIVAGCVFLSNDHWGG